MFFVKLVFFAMSGFLISYGLILQVRGILNKAFAKSKENHSCLENELLANGRAGKWQFFLKKNEISIGLFLKLTGFLILGYLIIHYQAKDLVYGLISFFIPAIAIILWILLARRHLIR